MILCRQEYGYCFTCREENRERKKTPRCDETNGVRCERVAKWWEDGGKTYHYKPFQLHPNNHLAFELYNWIIQLSPTQSFVWSKGTGKKAANYEGTYPSLSAMDFALKYFLPHNYPEDELAFLIEKIAIIYNMRIRSKVG